MPRRAKLAALHSTSHVTANALSQVLRRIHEIGLPDASSRRTIARARQDIAFEETEFGPILQPMKLLTKTGGELTVWVQHPLALLSKLLGSDACVASLLMRMENAEIVMYSDEVHPGDAVKGNDRKVQCVYWTIMNFGTSRVCSETFWFSATCTRTSVVKRVQDGMSQVYKRLLKLFFGRPSGHDLRNGVVFQLPSGQCKLLHASMKMFTQDESAGKDVLCAYGASGVKECFMCKTTIKHTSTLLPHPGLLPSTCIDPAQFVLSTTSSLRKIAKRLHSAMVAGDPNLAELEKTHGFHAASGSLLLDEDLDIDIMGVWCWDWMHVYLQGGVLVNEVAAFLERAGGHGLGIATLDAYLARFQWPKRMPSATSICRDTKNELRATPNGSASEYLSLVPVLEKFLVDVVQKRGGLDLEADSLLACCAVVTLLQCSSQRQVQPNELQDAMTKHFALQQTVYGVALWLPKSHYALHLPMVLAILGILLGTFVQERRHKIVKRHCQPHQNTTNLEKGLMEEVTQTQMTMIFARGESDAVHLTEETDSNPIKTLLQECFPTLVDVHTSQEASVNFRKIRSGDVVVYKKEGGTQAGQVWYHFRIDTELFTCVCCWPTESVETNCLKCRVAAEPELVQTSQLIAPTIFAPASLGKIATVLITDSIRREL